MGGVWVFIGVGIAIGIEIGIEVFFVGNKYEEVEFTRFCGQF